MVPVDSLQQRYDGFFFDLDGTIYRGNEVIDHVVPALAKLQRDQTFFLTNNASRSAQTVADHLTDLHIPTQAFQVITSAQAAGQVLKDRLAVGSIVLVVGTHELEFQVDKVGMEAVRTFDAGVVAVVQGHSTTTGWADLAEACLAINSGCLWVATNVDPSLPNERGLLPGNGSMVAALQTATGKKPVIAGKPFAPIIDLALAKGDFSHPLIVGDRLDTDIASARVANADSVLVLTGVHGFIDVLSASYGHIPTFIIRDLSYLCVDVVKLNEKVSDNPWSCQIVNHDGHLKASFSLLKSDSDIFDLALLAINALSVAVYPMGVYQDLVSVPGNKAAEDFWPHFSAPW